jgi:hypothetical protein
MASGSTTRSTPQLVSDVAHQFRQLVAAEVGLLQAELAGSAAALSAGLGRAAAGAGLLYAGLILFLVAISFFLMRLGLPADVSFLLVALAVLLTGWLLVRSGSSALQPARLLPARSIAQINSLMKGL